jgi:hypothetical protein
MRWKHLTCHNSSGDGKTIAARRPKSGQLDTSERQRCYRVAANSPLIYASLGDELLHFASRYNDDHPQNFGLPDALTIDAQCDSGWFMWRVQKNTAPTRTLLATFLIDSAEMTFAEGSRTRRVRLDYIRHAPTFETDGKSCSVEQAVESLVMPMLAS